MPINTIGAGSGAAAGIDLLFGTTLSADTASIDTGTLATGYRDLMIYATGRSNRVATNAELLIQFNGDTTSSNYEGLYRITGDATAGADTSGGVSGYILGTNASALRVASNVIHVPNHEGTTHYKAYHGQSGAVSTTTFRLQTRHSSIWLSTSAITSVQFKINGGDDFLSGTTISVYGVK